MHGSIPDAFDLLKIAQTQHYDIVQAMESRAGARVEALVKEHARIARKNLGIALQDVESIGHVPGASLIQRRGNGIP
jgi:GntR family transcriptional regulator of vanillate catabolism